MPEKIIFKKKFIERYSRLTNFEKFKEYSLKYLRRSIRINTLKISIPKLKKRLKNKNLVLTEIPWCKQGFWIKHKTLERRDIGNLPEHYLGYFYVQEAVSMIPPILLNPQPYDLVLDMCASPGSKTTQIAALMENKGIIIANDVSHERLASLGVNLQRCGVSNTIITKSKAQYFNLKFNKILLDAPCSGTGTIRKSFKTLTIWNPNMVKRISNLQKRLIATAFSCLKPKGTLVYSTCSLEPEENEAVIDFLLKKFKNAKLEKINLKIKRSSAVLKFENKTYSSEIKKCLRIWPQDNDTEGFFIAKIRKVNN
jgi:NOL1/NOP2/sun family putative RNA methylase